MSQLNVLAFDLGASSGRAIVGCFDGTRVTLQEVHRFDNGVVDMRGHLYWAMAHLYDEMCAGLRAAQQAGPITSMGIDTWGVDGAFLGAHDTLLGYPCAYRDFELDNMNACIAELGAERLYGITGIQFMPFNTIFQFYRHRRQGNPVLAAAARFLFIPDYLRFLFTGDARNEYTIASTAQMLDARSRTWSPEILELLGLPLALLGELIEPGAVCGTVEDTQIKAIAVAGHDTGSAVLSVPATGGDSWAWLSSGTWSIIGVETDEPITSEESRARNFSNEGGAYGTIRYLKNIAGLWLAQECRRVWKEQGKDYSYADLDRLVKDTPAGGPIIDVDDPRFAAPTDMPAEIQAACREGGQRVPESVGEIQRCILESLAARYAERLDELARLTGRSFARLHMVGGGINNRRLNQMTADACNMAVETGPVEGTAIGNIIVQLIALGEVDDIAQGRELIKSSFPTDIYEPRHQ